MLIGVIGGTAGLMLVGGALYERGLLTYGSATSTEAAPGDRGTVAGSLEAANPIGIRVPSIDVDAATVPLGLDDDGTIEVPNDFSQTGWWKDGPEPGEIGPAVILGHVDSHDGPAVFFEVDGLVVGDLIHIDRADGSTVSYAVQRIEQHAKADFPTAAVYGPTNQSELRLVTCGGAFDRDARSYEDNVIVFAVAIP